MDNEFDQTHFHNYHNYGVHDHIQVHYHNQYDFHHSRNAVQQGHGELLQQMIHDHIQLNSHIHNGSDDLNEQMNLPNSIPRQDLEHVHETNYLNQNEVADEENQETEYQETETQGNFPNFSKTRNKKSSNQV